VLSDVPQLQERARFEHAYALYISGNAAKAVEVAAKGDDSRAMKHVLAQAVR
jgi:signal recognition particle subunit SRP72